MAAPNLAFLARPMKKVHLININGDYPVKIKVMTEVKETADGDVVSSAIKTYTFGDESKVIHPDAPTITGPAANSSTVTISVVRPADLNDTWSILYTVDGSDPSSSSTAQVITSASEDPTTHEVTTSGPVALPEFCMVRAVVRGTTCPDAISEESQFIYDDTHTIYLLPPDITFNGTGSLASTIITPSALGCTIHYTINGGEEHTYTDYSQTFVVYANDRVEAWVTKAGPYVTSDHNVSTYLPVGSTPGSSSGLYGDVVYLDDRESHSLSYYSDGTQPVHSLNPVDVKITYFGNGTGTVNTTNGPTPNNNRWTANATGVQVGPNAPGNQFVYYETLEAGDYYIDNYNNSNYINLRPDYEGTSRDYPYSLIPNPFSVRHLIDNLTGTRYDMLENDSYVFEGRKDDYYSRFYITFDCLDVEEYEEDAVEKTFAFFDGSQWVVTGEGSLELIDLQGRILWQERVSGGQSRVNIPDVAKSLYLLRLVNSSEGTKVQKIVID